jgi:hypothetical protein
VVLGQSTKIDLQFKDVRPVKEAPPNLAADPFNLLQRQQKQTAEQSAQRSIPRTVLDWDIGQLSRNRDACSDSGASESDEPGVSGRELEGRAELTEKARGGPLRSGVEIVVKKGPSFGRGAAAVTPQIRINLLPPTLDKRPGTPPQGLLDLNVNLSESPSNSDSVAHWSFHALPGNGRGGSEYGFSVLHAVGRSANSL